ncbi:MULTISPECIES: hypothetical protein [unclassified Rhodococcus (in: high G+C Gram-positive bacteria)]|uniref:hypothetical protein n=1 Tax=unclassified Rhodococcus (in: high G+C Gram-positive bacteria) TaxID=192944 RepID=UPI001639EEEE|nr:MULTISPECIES: hypothetical protein [unclassified Rhodococcus (in: high G+C Gram-positive bacteria)]MBC2640506.1 hypothetical protein [Rhodococcus sp. 3A]MBC2894748.1 hypothetical protein [Rhodococcus sp. 4CII]
MAALRAEWIRIWRNPADTLATVAFNAVLMIGAWFLLPRNWLFEWTGPSGFALALAGWMYADVTATNVLAPDRERILAALDDRDALGAMLGAKAVALWMLIAPLCATIAIAVGFADRDWLFTAVVVVAVALCPFGPLAGSSLVGVFFPYHQRPLRWRWEQRVRWRTVVVRWLILLVVPYAVFPAFSAAIAVVPVVLWRIVKPDDVHTGIGTADFALCVLVAVASSALMWVVARRIALSRIQQHAPLADYLRDRDRG